MQFYLIRFFLWKTNIMLKITFERINRLPPYIFSNTLLVDTKYLKPPYLWSLNLIMNNHRPIGILNCSQLHGFLKLLPTLFHLLLSRESSALAFNDSSFTFLVTRKLSLSFLIVCSLYLSQFCRMIGCGSHWYEQNQIQLSIS